MPSDKGFQMLVRGRKPDDRLWVSLIEARGELIKPHLNSFTLPELGHLECLRRETFRHAIFLDAPQVAGDDRFSLKTQGIFCAQPFSAVERIPDSGRCAFGTMRIWGLTRAGLWVLATIDFRGEAGYKDRGYERATNVGIIEADVPIIIARTKEKPEKIWERLGNAIKIFAENRKRLYIEAENLVKMVQIEELALSLIPG